MPKVNSAAKKAMDGFSRTPSSERRKSSADLSTIHRAGASIRSARRQLPAAPEYESNQSFIPRIFLLHDWRRGKLLPILQDKLWFRLEESTHSGSRSEIETSIISFSMYDDARIPSATAGDELAPLSIASIYHFCKLADDAMQAGRERGVKVVYWSNAALRERTHAAFLIGAYLVLKCGMAPATVMGPFAAVTPYPFEDFRDKSSLDPDCIRISLLDVWRGLHKGASLGMLKINYLNIDDYSTHGDPLTTHAHIVVPGKLVAFKGPADPAASDGAGEPTGRAPEDYLKLWSDWGVSAVVRLTDKRYDEKVYTDKGLAFFELPFDDENLPSPQVVERFLEICRGQAGAVAIHCNAGLGRTGTLIAVWLILHKHFEASEAVGWVRVFRPGSIVGPQLGFLFKLEKFASRATVMSVAPAIAPPAADGPEPRRRSLDSSYLRPPSSAATAASDTAVITQPAAASAAAELAREVERLRARLRQREAALAALQAERQVAAAAGLCRAEEEAEVAAKASLRAATATEAAAAAAAAAAAERAAAAAEVARMTRRAALKDSLIAFLLALAAVLGLVVYSLAAGHGRGGGLLCGAGCCGGGAGGADRLPAGLAPAAQEPTGGYVRYGGDACGRGGGHRGASGGG